jgi:hypothetical protein
MNKCLNRFSLVVSLLFLSGVCADAQTVTRSSDSTNKSKAQLVQKPKVKKPKPISKELSGGFRLNTGGWSIFAERGVVKSEEKESDLFYNLRYAQIEFSEKKHPKEMRSTSGNGGSEAPRTYIYGKINNFYTFKVGYGNRRMIAGKPDPGTVSIHWIYNGGLSLGMAKPYYLSMGNGKDIKYSDEDKEDFLAGQNIVGSAGFGKGLNQIKFIPGLQVRTGLHFDFAPRERKHTKLALETGMTAELYTKKIELMANQKAVPYFVNLYVSLQFGRRWE